MAKKPATIDPAATYRISLTKVVQVHGGRTILHPRQADIKVSGKTLQAIQDQDPTAVSSVEPV